MPLTEFNEPLGLQRAAHLLRRCCWGGKITEINEFSSLTAMEAFERLTEEDIPDPILPPDPRSSDGSYISRVDGKYIHNNDASNEAQAIVLQWHHETALMTAYGGVPPDQKPAFIFRERLCYFFYTLFPTILQVWI